MFYPDVYVYITETHKLLDWCNREQEGKHVLRSQKRLAHLEMQLLAMRRHSLRGAVGALEGPRAAFRQLHDGLLGDNMSTRHPHWGVLVTGLLPQHRAHKDRVILEFWPDVYGDRELLHNLPFLLLRSHDLCQLQQSR